MNSRHISSERSLFSFISNLFRVKYEQITAKTYPQIKFATWLRYAMLSTVCLTFQSSATFPISVSSLVSFSDLFPSRLSILKVWSTATSTPKSHLLRRAKCIRRPLRVVKWQRRSDATRRSAGEVKLNCFKSPPPPDKDKGRDRLAKPSATLKPRRLGVILSFRRPPGLRDLADTRTQTTGGD